MSLSINHHQKRPSYLLTFQFVLSTSSFQFPTRNSENIMVQFGLLALFGLLNTASAAAAKTVKVMPLGASIMSKCWRANLQTSLRATNINNFNFVGTQTSNCAGNGIEQNHEGHPGSLVTEYVRDGNATAWLNAASPDVVIILIGTNDVLLGKKPVADVTAAYDALLAQIRTKNARMQIVFSTLLPLDPARWPAAAVAGVKELNTAIASYAPSKSTSTSPVYFVDNASGFDPASDTYDGEHPNDSGNAKIAAKFLKPTQDAIKAASEDGGDDNDNDDGSRKGQSGTTSMSMSGVLDNEFTTVIQAYMKAQAVLH